MKEDEKFRNYKMTSLDNLIEKKETLLFRMETRIKLG